VLKLPGSATGSNRTAYEGPAIGHGQIGALIDLIPSDGGTALREAVEVSEGPTRHRTAHIADDPHGAPPLSIAVARRAVGSRTAGFYRRTGIDVLHLLYRLRGVRRGAMLERLLAKRTGEGQLPPIQDLAAIIAQARTRVGP